MHLFIITRVFLTERDARYKKWKMAVERSLGWEVVQKSEQMTGKVDKSSTAFS